MTTAPEYVNADAVVVPKILVTVGEAAEMLGTTRAHIYELTAAGEFTKRYIGRATRNYRLEVEELREYAKRLPTEPRQR